MKIHNGGRAGLTPAFAILAEAWNELVQEGLTPDLQGTSPVSLNHEVIYATGDSDDDIIGVLAWVRAAQIVTLDLLYVEPSSRRQGVGLALVQAFLDREREDGRPSRIHVNVDGANKPMALLLNKLKATPFRTVYRLGA